MTPMRIAIGPARPYPSWQWCGADLVPGLRAVHDVSVFRGFSELSDSTYDAIIVIKQPPSVGHALGAGRLIYLPVDFFVSEGQILGHAAFLGSCHAVATHCDALDRHLAPHCGRIAHVEHHGRHVLPTMADHRPGGPVLWTGQGTYARRVLDWYGSVPMRGFDLVMLTNPVGWDWERHPGPGVTLSHWSEDAHRRALSLAGAGLDLKGDDFNQRTKPPTKIQQFVASGIPAMVNRDSYPWEYFHARGFDLATPDDVDRWSSRGYREETREFGLGLRERISIGSVVSSYLGLLHD